MHFAVVRGREDLLQPLARTIELVRASLIDPVYGGWYSTANADDKSKGNVWKVDYHVVGMCAEAVRLGAIARGPSAQG
jgi:mannose/cellobiose epimerase-like protein (N-acyl-D-glucosamine 2-epimerase family)